MGRPACLHLVETLQLLPIGALGLGQQAADLLDGGTLYVDGHVKTIEECGLEGGIVYVNGNVGRLENAERLILVTTGKIGEYEVEVGFVNPTLGSKRIPSPFIFASGPVEAAITRVHSQETPFQGVYVVPKEDLVGWKPEEVKQRALGLCKKRTFAFLDQLKKGCRDVNNPLELVKFWRNFIHGYETGRVLGRLEELSKGSGFED